MARSCAGVGDGAEPTLSIVFHRELEKKFAEAGVAHTADNSRSDINVVVFIIVSLSLTSAFRLLRNRLEPDRAFRIENARARGGLRAQKWSFCDNYLDHYFNCLSDAAGALQHHIVTGSWPFCIGSTE